MYSEKLDLLSEEKQTSVLNNSVKKIASVLNNSVINSKKDLLKVSNETQKSKHTESVANAPDKSIKKPDSEANEKIPAKLIKNFIDIKNLVKEFSIKIIWIPTNENLADSLTKSTTNKINQKLMNAILNNQLTLGC